MIASRRPIRLSFTAARNQSGMSLLEIIIVIVLIGAVLTLVASRVLGGADRGKANIAKAQVQTVASKIDNYQIDTGKLPGALNDLISAPAGVAGWLGPYAKAADLNDPWGHALEYRAPGEGQPYELISLGKDGKAGGSSVDADIRYQP